MTWEAWAWIAWMVGFGVLEALGLVRHPEGSMTLTYFLEHHIPKWLLAAFLGWLSWHFLVAPLARR